MTTNFEKFISEVDREIREKLLTKTSHTWKGEYEADCSYQKYCEDILDYEGGLTENENKDVRIFINLPNINIL